MNFTSTRMGNSLFDQMKERVFNQKTLEEMQANYKLSGGELEEVLDGIEGEYIFNLQKLDDIAELESRDEQIKKSFLKLKFYSEDMAISEKAKLQIILTGASVLNKVNTRVEDLQEQELYLLSAAMVPVPLEDYNIYGDVLSNPFILNFITQKTDDMTSRLDMCYQIFDYCDDYVYEDMNQLEYQKSIKDCLMIVNNFQVIEKENIK